jgi:DNA-binding transcriptional ArsR family regulator
MGKTSIVQNLAAYAPAGSLLVYLDLAGATATVEQMGDLLLDLADKIHATAAARFPHLPQPHVADYQQAKSADLHLQRLLHGVIDSLPDGAFLILALDEFEALERAVTRGKLPTEIYRYLRMLSQQPRLLLVLAGLHTLDEMSRDYQQAFFSSYHNVRVSYLPFHEAERLIARPTPEFTVNYERSVIEAIYHQTYGQPLLIQSICSALVNQLNHELFDLELQREARILPADLDAILTDKFVRKESRYFEGIWRDQIAAFPEQQRILHLLARQDEPLTVEQLVSRSSLSIETITQALQALAKRDVVIEEQGQWRLLMPLFQRWLQMQESQEG